MWWHGSGVSGGLWLPEDKKANMWHGRGINGGLGCLPSPAHLAGCYPNSLGRRVEDGQQHYFYIRATIHSITPRNCLQMLNLSALQYLFTLYYISPFI